MPSEQQNERVRARVESPKGQARHVVVYGNDVWADFPFCDEATRKIEMAKAKHLATAINAAIDAAEERGFKTGWHAVHEEYARQAANEEQAYRAYLASEEH